jgi:hypothetical protein
MKEGGFVVIVMPNKDKEFQQIKACRWEPDGQPEAEGPPNGVGQEHNGAGKKQTVHNQESSIYF